MGSKFSKGVRMHEKIHSRVRLDRASASTPNTGSVGAHSATRASRQLFLFLLQGIEGGLDFLRMLFDLCLQRGPCDLSWRTAFIAETYGCLTGQPGVCIGAVGPGTQSFCFISSCRSNGASPSRVGSLPGRLQAMMPFPFSIRSIRLHEQVPDKPAPPLARSRHGNQLCSADLRPTKGHT